jgi:hypothetical protein
MPVPTMADSTDLTSPLVVLARQKPCRAVWFQQDQNYSALVLAPYLRVCLRTVTAQKKKRRMTSETKRKIIDAIGEEFQAAGLGGFDEAIHLMEEDRSRVMQGLKGGILASAMKQFDDAPEPSAEDLEKTLGNINGKLRYDLRRVIVKALQQYKNILPYRRGGGRQKALTAEQRVEACDAVSALIRRGRISFKGAFLRVAQEFTRRLGHNVSARTVQRAWQARSKNDSAE